MRTKVGHLAMATLAVICTGSAFSFVETEELCVEPDHFLSYPFNPLPSSVLTGEIGLRDAFIEVIEDDGGALLGPLVGLLNPAIKWHNGKISRPNRPNTHYLAVAVGLPIGVTLPTVELLTFNQFGTRTFTTEDFVDIDGEGGGVQPLVSLLVPSVKKACEGGSCGLADLLACDDCFPDGDHYLCYDLLPQDECCSGNARFEDQFIKNRIIEALSPVRICNPVDKTENGVLFEANHEETNHLICYDVGDKNISTRLVHLLNQFGQQAGWVRTNNEVCVPSTTIDVTPIAPAVH
jgi:hypothetical protein